MITNFYNALECFSWTTALLTTVVCIVFYAFVKWSGTQPGPVGLPYIGYYPFLRSDCHVQLVEMSKKYGDAFLLRCTGQLYVHLGSLKTIKEAHLTKSDCFTRRSTTYTVFQDTFGEGVGFSNDEKWRVLRKFFAHELREFGLGRKTQEGLIGDILERTVQVFRESKGRKVDVLAFFTEAAAEVILRLLLSGTKLDDGDVKKLAENFKFMSELMVTPAALLAGPLLKYVLRHVLPEFRRYQRCHLEMESILRKIIRQREKEFSKDTIRNLVDCFINERNMLEEKGDLKYKLYTESALVSTILQFFGDGTLSVGLLTAIVLREISGRPEVQKEIQREVIDVVGTNRFPSWDDRSTTHYTNSVIYEILRTCNFFPLFASLECTKATTINGCHVPKGAITLVNFYAALHDTNVYEEPENFDPTRFMLNEERKPKSELPIIFGVGKRACTGEPLVTMEIFLFVTTVLQNFTLHPAGKDGDLPTGTKNAFAEESMFLRATSTESQDL